MTVLSWFLTLGSYYVCTQVKGSQYDILMGGLQKSGLTGAKDVSTSLEGILDILCSFCTFKFSVSPRKTVLVASYVICHSNGLRVQALC